MAGLLLNMDPELKKMAEDEASKLGLSLSEFIRSLIIIYFEGKYPDIKSALEKKITGGITVARVSRY